MRYVCAFAAVLLALVTPSSTSAENGADGLTIENYQLVSEQRLNRTDWHMTFRADLVNKGVARAGVVATVTSLVSSIKVVPDQNTLYFGPTASNARTTSTNTFTILVDRNVPLDFANLKWSFLNPVSIPGPDQTAAVGSTVNLNGSASTNPSGVGSLSYNWVFASRPAGSTAALVNPNSVAASFVIDRPGTYIVNLTVNNGVAQDTRSVKISTVNSPPVAKAGPNQSVAVGALVNLSGSASSDVDGDPLSYTWTFVSVPAGSNAISAGIGSFRSVNAFFTADVAGTFIVQLIVNDGTANSEPSTVTITSGAGANTPPVANAGPNQAGVAVGSMVQLTGAGSTDVDGDPLTYKWTLITRPNGSAAQLSNTAIVNPTFVADLAGTYIAQLIVNDGKIDSAAATVTITTATVGGAPTANAGPNQTVVHGTTVQLNGSGSDPQSRPLTYQWSFTTRPAGSNATLSNAAIANPTFVADRPGQYVLQLIVNNGTQSSTPATVTITTTNTAPVANAGANQTVSVGSVVNLDGGGSTDADNDPLTYAWSFTTRPAGSNAALSAAASKTPTFNADVAGTYIVQLIVSDAFASSTPKTVTITANANVADLIVPATLTVAPDQTKPYNISIAQPAATDVSVNLENSDPTRARLSLTSVLIPAGSTTPTRQVYITGLANGALTIKASAPGRTPGTTNVTVGLSASLAPENLIISGASQDGTLTITLSGQAQSNITFSIQSSNTGVVSVPSTVPLLLGNQSTGFKVMRVSPGTAVVTVTAPGLPPMTANVTVQAPGNISLAISNTNLYLWQWQTLTVTLSQAAGAGGVPVNILADAKFLEVVPKTVTVPQGATSATAQVRGVQVGNPTIGATAQNYNSAQAITVAVGATIAWVSPTVTYEPDARQPDVRLTLFATVPGGTQFDPNDAIKVDLTSSRSDVAQFLHSSALFLWDGSTEPTLRIPIVINGPGTTILRAKGTNIPEVSMTLIVTGPVAITTAALPEGNAGLQYSFKVEAAGGAEPYSWTATGLPANLTINAATGQITGTPNAAGTSTVNVTVMDSSNPKKSANATFSLKINQGTPASIAVSSGSPQSAKINTAFASPLRAVVRDTNNTPLAGVTVTFTQPANGGATGSFAGGVNTAVTDANGIATSAVFTANDKLGTYQVQASVNGNPALNTNFSLTNTVGDPASITVSSGSPQSAPLNNAFGLPLRAVVKDAGGNPVPNVSVTFAAPGGGASGSFAGGVSTATTDANGIATSAVFTANATAGNYNVSASVTANPALTTNFALTNLVGTPASITVSSGSPQSAKINTAFPNVLRAVVRDNNNSPLAGVTVTFTVPGSGASATFANGATAVTDANGIATSGVLTANGTVGSYNVTAIAAANITTTFNLTNTVGDPASIAVSSGAPQSSQVNTQFGLPLRAIVKDNGGNPVPNVSVTFTPPAGGATGTFAGAVNTATTDANGIATAAAFSATGTVGNYNVVAIVTANPALSTNFALTNTAGTPTSIVVFSGSPQSAKVNTPFANPLKALVRDANNNPLAGITVTFTAPGSGASGTFTNNQNTNVTDENGIATSAIFTANSTLGTYSVVATAALGVTTNFNLTNTVGDPATIAVSSGSPQSAETGTAFAQLLRAIVKDSGGNPVPNVSVTFTPPGSGAGGTFAGGVNTATTGADGIATAAAFTANTTLGGPYNVVAAVTGNAGVTPANFALTNVAGPPATITVVSGNNQSTGVGAAFANPLRVQVKDASGNSLSNITVTFTAPPSGATATFAGNQTTAVTDSNGFANSAILTANNVIGAYSIGAQAAPGVTTTFSLTNTAGPPATITVISGTPQQAPVGTPFGAPFRVQVKDAGGNGIANVIVTFTPPANGARGTFAGGVNTATTDANGFAQSAAFTANLVAGNYMVAASVNALSANFALTNNPLDPSAIAVADGSLQTTAINTNFANPLKAVVRDQHGNPVSGVTVTFTAVPGGSGATGTFSNNQNTMTAVTDATGIATTSAVKANAIPGNFTVTVTGIGLPTVSFLLTNSSTPVASLVVNGGTSPQSTAIATLFPSVLKVLARDSNGNPVNGADIVFTVNPAIDTGAAGSFLGNVNTAKTDASGVASSQPFTANGKAGTFSVRAAVASNAAVFADFMMTNVQGGPCCIVVMSGSGQTGPTNSDFLQPLQAKVTDQGGNPLRAVQVTFTAPASGPGGTFSNGTTSIVTSTDSLGLASTTFRSNGSQGTYAVSASLSGGQKADFTLTNQGMSGGVISVTNTTIGKNLQDSITITLDPPAPNNLPLTIRSLDSTKVLVANAMAVFSPNLLDGTANLGVTVQALADTGQAMIEISAPNYNTATAIVNLSRSGFVIAGPNGTGAAFEAFRASNTPLTVRAMRIDANGNFVQTQQLRTGWNNPADNSSGLFTVRVPVSINVSSLGSLSAAFVTIAGNSNSGTVNFMASPVNTGATDILVNSAGATLVCSADYLNAGKVCPAVTFVTPTTGSKVTATVKGSDLIPFVVTVGKNLQKVVRVSLTGPAAASTPVTITSTDPSKVLFATNATNLGTSSIEVTIPPGFTQTPNIYVQAFDEAGSVPYTISAASYGSSGGLVELAPAGFVIESPGGYNASSFSIQKGSSNATLTVHVGLAAAGIVTETQLAAPGVVIPVTVTSSNTGVGTITTSPINIVGGSSSATTQFKPVEVGTTAISVSSTGYQPSQVAASVTTGKLVVSTDLTVGNKLQNGNAFVALPQPAGAGGVQVTIQSNSPSLKLSATQTGAGTDSIVITVPEGAAIGGFWVQGLANSGIGSFTASTALFASATGTVTFVPAAIVIFPDTLTGFAGSTPELTVFAVALTPDGFNIQELAGGTPVNVNVHTTSAGIAAVPSTVTIPGGMSSVALPVELKAAGGASISITQPAGFTIPTSYTSTSVSVIP